MKTLLIVALFFVAAAFGQTTGPKSPAASNAGVKLAGPAAIEYVSPAGNDSNDGLSWGNAKRTVRAALQALPGGNFTTAGHGLVELTDGVSWSVIANQGLWLMGSTDPNYSDPPNGWLKVSGALTFMCNGGQSWEGNSHYPACNVQGGSRTDTHHPSIWISGVANPMRFQGILSQYIGTSIKLGICSNGDRTGTCGTQNQTFEGVSGNLGNGGLNVGPAVDIGSNTFWIWFKDCVFSGNPGAAAVTNDNAQAVVINPSTGYGSGLIHFKDTVLNSGGIKVYAGRNGGNVFVDHLTTENKLQAAVWFVNYVYPMFSEINHVEVADCSGAGCYAIENDAAPASAIVAIDVGSAISGGVTNLGGAYNVNPASLPSVTGSAGVFDGHLYGKTDVARRLFSPVAVQFQNLAQQAPADWTRCSSCTVSTVRAPDGTNNAGQVSTSSKIQQHPSFYHLNAALNVGDEYLFGVWALSQTANGFSGGAPATFSLTSNGHGSGDTCSNGHGNLYLQGYSSAGWAWYSGICKVTSVASEAGIEFVGSIDKAHTAQFYAPVVLKIPAKTLSDNDVYEYLQAMSSYSASCSPGEICGLPGQTLHEDTFNVTMNTPGSSSATCRTGDIWADASYVYVCTAANRIKRAPLNSF